MLGIGLGLTSLNNSLASVIAQFIPSGASTNNVLVADIPTGTFATNGAVGSFSDVFSHTRAGNAVETASDGTLKWAPHNLLQYSEDFTQSAWEKLYNGDGVDPVVTANAATAPDGSMTADRVVFSRGAANNVSDYSLVLQNPIDNETVRFGLWVRSNTGLAQTIMVYITNNSVYDDTFTVGTDWTFIDTGSVAKQDGSVAFGTRGNTISGDYGGDENIDILIWGARVYRTDLGGMSDNPATGDSYVPTDGAAVYLPRTQHHVPDGSGGWAGPVCLIEPEATNLLLNSGPLSTQDVTVTAEPHTLHFTGTGTVTLSGASTAGPLVGTGTGEDNRVSVTFTPTAGTLTLTVSGTVSNAQMETGYNATSYIPTAGAQGDRAADILSIAAATCPDPASGSHHVFVTYADTGAAAEQTIFDRRVDANNRITLTLDTDGAKTGTFTLTMVNGGSSASTSHSTEITPGVSVEAHVAWRVTSSEIQIALNGVSETATSTAIGIPDLSSADADFDGITGSRMTDVLSPEDWGDAGIAEITT